MSQARRHEADNSVEAQEPPLADPENGDNGNGPAPRIPKYVRLRRLRVWLRFIRLKLARAILLPELKPAEAHDLRHSVDEDGALTSGYMLMCALSAGIATLGLLQSSIAVVIGAMLISPLMSPIAALGFGFASIDGDRIRKAVRVVAVGAGIGILTAMLITWISPIRNATPEILARTQPTLLDLAIALFSGIAGGYATVIGKGGTAIGVAIATALMPPLAVLGYGLGVLQIQFALGALLLFMTNLAAITLSFALIARLSGASRPLFSVEWKPRYIVVLVAAFLVLAIPLSMTLSRLSQEARMRDAARSAIISACGGKNVDIAQIEVSWPLFGEPTVDALVVAPTYSPNAEVHAEEQLAKAMGDAVAINLQQVQATDFQSQTQAMIDAAMERTTAGIAADVPPYDRIRASIGLPTRAIWTNRAERRVYVEPIPVPDWTLADYAEIEKQANRANEKWNVRILPPPPPQLRILLEPNKDPVLGTITPEMAAWALNRWGMGQVTVAAPAGKAAQSLLKKLHDAGVTVSLSKPEDDERASEESPSIAVVNIYAKSPTQRAAEAAAAAAEKAEKERQELELDSPSRQ
ncbi:MAG: TIGR00341 family protein [Sphingomonadaceae bacterium]|nr:TIGR00341 family protein [Sphingomonadaceae bacterium]